MQTIIFGNCVNPLCQKEALIHLIQRSWDRWSFQRHFNDTTSL